MIVLDASVLIAALAPDDAHHDAARALILTSPAPDALIHPLTLAEVLVGPAGRDDVVQFALRLADLGIRQDVPDADQPQRLAELRASTRLRLPDCCVLDLATFHESPLATFDERLAQVAGARGVDVLPGP